MIAVLAAVLFGLAFFQRRKAVYYAATHPTTVFGSSIVGFALLGAGAYYFVSDLIEAESVRWLALGVFVFSILSAIYFLMEAGNFSSRKIGRAMPLFALAPILLTGFRLLGDFLRHSSMPMASSGAYHILGLASLLLFFLAEGKVAVGTGNAFVYTLFGYLSILFSLVYALPNLVIHAYGPLPFDYLALYSAVDLTMVLYVVVRLAVLPCRAVPAEEPAAE